ncbi:MAG: hypothetical protein LLG01_14695 [Planctomycetaceae bacterium]|nr:hypothetical protein [Planctomycetaceae bacterium]
MAREYKIAKTEALCRNCQAAIGPGEELVAAVREQDGEFLREDYCLKCLDAVPSAPQPDVYAVWRTKVPAATEKKKRLLVDDSVLLSFFQRLDGSDDPVKIDFRYVLALVLMRKKLLAYDRSRRVEGGGEIWSVHLRKTGEPYEVIDPKLDEDRIAQVSQSLSDIIEGEL